MKLNLMAVSVIALALFAAGCSSSGAGGSSEMPTVEDQATSTAVVGACGGASTAAIGDGLGTLSYGDRAAENVRGGLASYVARRAVEQLRAPDKAGLDKTMSYRWVGDTLIVTFANEVVTNPAGGSASLSGDFEFSSSQSGNTYTLTAGGDIVTVVTDWAATVTVEGVTYDEVVDGTWTMTFSGRVTSDVNYESISVDLVATVNGEDITVTGDASGTATISDFAVTVSGSGTDPDDYTTVCSGSVSVVGSGGTSETCNIAEDCSGCE